MKTKANDVGGWLQIAAERLSAASENPALEAQLLLAESLLQSRAWLLAHPEHPLGMSQANDAEMRLKRVLRGEPLPYVLGHWEFFGLDFIVSPAVLIPRPETELLVETAIAWLKANPAARLAADVGTGSGCIAAALARHIPNLQVVALEISPAASRIAQENFRRIGVEHQIHLLQSDLLEGLPNPVDVLCANLPYIPGGEVDDLPVSRSEPRLALDGGMDGLRVIERLLRQISEQSACRSLALLEIETRQGSAARALARHYFPQAEVSVLSDLAGHDRVLQLRMVGG